MGRLDGLSRRRTHGLVRARLQPLTRPFTPTDLPRPDRKACPPVSSAAASISGRALVSGTPHLMRPAASQGIWSLSRFQAVGPESSHPRLRHPSRAHPHGGRLFPWGGSSTCLAAHPLHGGPCCSPFPRDYRGCRSPFLRAEPAPSRSRSIFLRANPAPSRSRSCERPMPLFAVARPSGREGPALSELLTLPARRALCFPRGGLCASREVGFLLPRGRSPSSRPVILRR